MAIPSSSRLASVVCALLALGAGPGAAAQSPPPAAAAAPAQTTVRGVTVTGRRRSDNETIRTVIAPFVAVHAARDRKTGLLVRGPHTGVCPITLGLSPAFNAFVTARIVAVAREAGGPVQAAAGCRPNVEVVFTDAPQDLLDGMVKQTRGQILGFHFLFEERALARVTRPIQAWYATGTVSTTPADATHLVETGGPDGLQAYKPPQTPGPGGVVLDQAYWEDPYSGTGSHLHPPHSSELMNVLIVADTGKLDGHEIGPIADYIAMLSLSQPRSLDACNTLPSILDMMASGCAGRPAPQALTDSDAAFLKALYASDISTSPEGARYRIEHGMAKGLGGAGR